MGFVVIRRFRDEEAPASSRVFRDAAPALDAARAWAREGWEVELIENGRLQHRTTRLSVPPPPRPDSQ